LSKSNIKSIQRQRALADIKEGWKFRDLWLMEGRLIISNRYKRTFLGPFWITMQALLMIVAFSIVRGIVFQGGVKTEIVPYISIGMVVFTFQQHLFISSSSAFKANLSYMQGTNLPLSIGIYRFLFVELINFLHLIILFPILFIWPGMKFHILGFLLIPVWVFLTLLIFFFISLWLGIGANRFADIAPLISTVLPFFMFVTPVWWDIATVRSHKVKIITDYNPFNWILSLFREGILGQHLNLKYLLFFVVALLVNMAIGFHVFAKYKSQVVLWE